MQAPDEQRQASNFQIDVPDQRFRAAVADVVHLLMTEHHEELAERTRIARCVLYRLNLAAVSTKLAEQCQAVGPQRGVFAVYSWVDVIGLHIE